MVCHNCIAVEVVVVEEANEVLKINQLIKPINSINSIIRDKP